MSHRAALLVPDPKYRSALGRYFRSRGVRVVAPSKRAQVSQLIGITPVDVLVIDLEGLGKETLGQVHRWAGKDGVGRVLCLVGDDRQVPAPLDELEKLRPLPKPFRRADLERALAQGLPTSPTEKSMTRKRSGLRMSLRTKITLPYILLALILGVAAAVVTTQIVFDSVEERFTNQLIESGRLGNEWMVLEEDRLLEALRAVSRTEGVAASLQGENADVLRQLSLPIAVNSATAAIEFVNTDGTTLLSLRHRAGAAPEVYDASSGADLADLPFVAAALRGERDARGDKHSGIIPDSTGDWFYVSGPVYDAESNVVGAVLVGEPLSELARGMRAATLAQVSLYGLEGAVKDSTFLEPMGLGASDLNELDSGGETSYTRNLIVANIDYREIVGPWIARGSNELGLIGVSLPQSFLVRASRWTRVQVIGITASGFLLVIAVGFYISNRITDPLLQVVKASGKVAKGSLAVKVKPKGNDEITQLAHTFNEMVHSLRESRVELLEAYDSTLDGWSRALELRDVDTEGHTRRVVSMSTRLARAMGVNGSKLLEIRRGATLHDIGKMGIPDEILHKPTKLSEEEWSIMRLHPVYGHNMLKDIEYLGDAVDIPLYHHERWDGGGYPKGLKAEEIPLPARIFAVADVVDALLSDRPYRPAWTVEETLEYVRSNAGHHFDPEAVRVFFEALELGDISLRRHLSPARPQK